MKYVKIVGLLAAATVVLMASTSSASATITSPPGTVYTGQFIAGSTNVSFDGPVKLSCSKSTIFGTINKGETSFALSNVTFSECGNDTVVVLKKGTQSIASNGTVSSTGMELTVQLHRTIIFPHINVTTHCIYKTDNTIIGTLTEGIAPAAIHIGSALLTDVTTDTACGHTETVLTGTYTVSTPSSAIVVH